MVVAYSITDKQLESINSEYITNDVFSVIEESVKKTTSPTPKKNANVAAQLLELRKLYQWIIYTDAPRAFPYGEWALHSVAYNVVANELLMIMQELEPNLDVAEFTGTPRNSEETAIAMLHNLGLL